MFWNVQNIISADFCNHIKQHEIFECRNIYTKDRLTGAIACRVSKKVTSAFTSSKHHLGRIQRNLKCGSTSSTLRNGIVPQWCSCKSSPSRFSTAVMEPEMESPPPAAWCADDHKCWFCCAWEGKQRTFAWLFWVISYYNTENSHDSRLELAGGTST